MWRKTLSLALDALLVCAMCFGSPTFAQTIPKEGAPTAAQAEAAIARLREEFKAGRRAGGDPPTITGTSRKEFKSLTFPQSQTTRGNNFSTGAKIGIGVAVAAAVVIIITVASGGSGERHVPPPYCDPGPCR